MDFNPLIENTMWFAWTNIRIIYCI
jgi:hypothetical protein